jgi:hypothetical protein
VGAGRAGYDAFWSGFASFFERAAPAVRAEFAVFRGLMELDPAQRDVRPLPAVPLVVLVAAKYLPPPPIMTLPYDPQVHFEVDVRHRIRLPRRGRRPPRAGRCWCRTTRPTPCQGKTRR